MSRFMAPYLVRGDQRGTFTGLTNRGTWREVNLVETKAGVRRGGHYHRETTELFVILEGSVEVTLHTLEGVPIETFRASAGQVFQIHPQELHWVEALEPCRWLGLLSKPLDPDNPDIHVPDSALSQDTDGSRKR